MQKPKIIHFYNGTKGGVYLLDQMSAKYTVSQKTNLFINAYIVHRENITVPKEKVESRVHFLFSLGEELTKPFMLHKLGIPTLRRSIRHFLTTGS